MRNHTAVFVAIITFSAGCSEIVADFTFYTPDAGGQADGGALDAGCDLQCDGVCTDTQTDPFNCGGCGTACSMPDHGTAVCMAGTCGINCDEGYYPVSGSCEARLAPRPISPLSASTATSRRPTFRWELAARSDGARLEICADRACTSVLQTIDAAGTSGRPPTDLPPGVVFWRLFAREGTEFGSIPSVTWQLYIGARSADGGVDTSWGSALDVNGDGLADVLVGAPLVDSPGDPASNIGRAYLYYGNASGIDSTAVEFDNGADGGSFGHSVASAGDVDGNGYVDFIIGAPYFDESNGRAYLYLNDADGIDPNPAVLEIPDDGGRFGWSLAGVGDVDGDGYADFLIGAPHLDAANGRAYLYLNESGELDPAPRELESEAIDGQFGTSISSAGDIDGNGYADFMIGTPVDESVYVYMNRDGAVDPAPTVLTNATSEGSFGSSVASAGDVDGNGYADLLIGAPNLYVGDVREGRAYLYLNDGDGIDMTPVTLDNDGVGGRFGSDVAGVRDADGDGYGDFVVGADGADSYNGRAYLFLNGDGAVDESPRPLDNDADGGRFGQSTGGAGDIDGNGYSDFMVGAPQVGDADSDHGRVYIYLNDAGGISTSPASIGNEENGSFGSSLADGY